MGCVSGCPRSRVLCVLCRAAKTWSCSGGEATRVGKQADPANNYTADRNRCASKYALSIASQLGVSNDNFWGQALLGNDVSTISTLILGPGRTDAGLQATLSNPTPVNLINLTFQSTIQSASVDTGRLVLAQNGAGTWAAKGSVMTTFGKTAGGKIIGGVLSAVTAGKLLYDAAMYIDALVVCAEDPSLK